ncbi:ABC transporter permease [Pseudonocardia kujensis]|uniref:ABC transporter permease n=1 Tax=Pseudonocardia kujensis TaxID=1128675 RepID=UPI001E5568E0|nr:ABC transporter permease [Pseudonocardia kujensis]MCE0762421.1 ABC transporter permease [Pseudonocardia kujensis]
MTVTRHEPSPLEVGPPPGAPARRPRRRAPLSARYVAGRLATALVAVWAVFTLVFFSLLATGNPAQLLVAPDAPPGELERITALMGFDRPPLEQYATFLGRVVTGDLPDSIRYDESPLALVAERLPASITLGLTGLLLGTLLGAAAGYLGATARRPLLRRLPLSLLTALDAIPSFFLGILLIFVFAIVLRSLPATGGGTLAHLVLPALTLAVVVAAPVGRIFRTALLDVAELDHVRTARSKGIAPAAVTARHVVANALPPVLNVLGVQAGMVLGGAIVTEALFGWPGLGQLSVSALNNRDYPLVLACVCVIAIGFVLVNLAVDLLAALLDPRNRR